MKNESKPIESEVKGGQIVEKYSKKQNSSSGEIGPRIRRGRYQALKLFEVSEGECERLLKGVLLSSIYLNFSGYFSHLFRNIFPHNPSNSELKKIKFSYLRFSRLFV